MDIDEILKRNSYQITKNVVTDRLKNLLQRACQAAWTSLPHLLLTPNVVPSPLTPFHDFSNNILVVQAGFYKTNLK